LGGGRKGEGGLRYSFDKENDIFWAYTKGGPADVDELAEDIFVEFQGDEIVGVEIHNASKVLGEYWKDPEGAAKRALEIARRLMMRTLSG